MIAQSRVLFDNSPFYFNCLCVSPCAIRNIIREGYDIEGTCLGDICVTILCPFCSACQLFHETSKNNIKLNKNKNNNNIINVKSSTNTTNNTIENKTKTLINDNNNNGKTEE